MIVCNDKRVDDWVASRMSSDLEWGPHASIGLMDGERILAGFVYDNYNGAICSMHVAADRFTREFLRVAFDYPFRQLNLNAIVSPVCDTNYHACQLAQRVGGKLLTVIPEGHPDGNLNLYMLRRDECRFLEH